MYDIPAKAAPLLQQKKTHRRASILITIGLIVLTLLLIGGSAVFFFYMNNLYPKAVKAQATAVVQTIVASQARATAISQPQTLYTQMTSGLPVLNYSSSIATKDWDTNSQGDSNCSFTDTTYHIHVASNQDFFSCLDSGGGAYSNFVFQAQIAISNGSAGGIRFRATNQGLTGYLFEVSPNGLYAINVVRDNPPVNKTLLFGHSANVHSDSNVLTVIAFGSHFLYYINKQFIVSIDDVTLSTGLISLYAANAGHHTGVDVAFTNIQLWNL